MLDLQNAQMAGDIFKPFLQCAQGQRTGAWWRLLQTCDHRNLILIGRRVHRSSILIVVGLTVNKGTRECFRSDISPPCQGVGMEVFEPNATVIELGKRARPDRMPGLLLGSFDLGRSRTDDVLRLELIDGKVANKVFECLTRLVLDLGRWRKRLVKTVLNDVSTHTLFKLLNGIGS